MKLSIVCVTQAALEMNERLTDLVFLAQSLDAELVWGADGARAEMMLERHGRVVPVKGRFLEEMLEPVIDACTGDYVLRIDDDERVPGVMQAWLAAGEYTRHDSWFFARFNLWPDVQTVITTSPFFPDFQGRLTTRAKAHRPPTLHAGSPYPSYRAPVWMEHHAFLLKTKEQRRAITAKYHNEIHGTTVKTEEVDVVFPEDMADRLTLEPVSSELMGRANKVIWWRQAGENVPPELQKQFDNWSRGRPIRPQVF